MKRIIRNLLLVATIALPLQASAQGSIAELKCVISAFDEINAYWVENKYNGQLSYSGENDPDDFEIHMDIPPTAFSFKGDRPQDKLDGLINAAFADDEALQARFRTDCTH